MKPLFLAGLLALATTAGVACGGEKTDVSQGVSAVNKELAAQGVSIDCPDEVDGGEGTEFDCTAKGTQTGKSAAIKMKIVKENGDLAVDFADEAAAAKAVGVST